MLRTLLLIASLASGAAPASAAAAPPPIKHVFVLVMENHNYDETFGKDSKAPFLAKTLTAQGQLLTQYYGIAHFSLPNYIAMISGQGPNVQTQTDCQFYNEFAPGTIGADGQAMGAGCVYPAAVKTVADQLTAKGLTWGGYMEDMGNATGEAQTCRHPELNMRDGTQSAKDGDQYAARHNPFVYFHSIIDSPDCAKRDVPLTRLPTTLAADDVPNYVFITPNLCSDGHDGPCVDGKPGGLEGINGFLQTWVPLIQKSRAYRDGGLIVVTFDESESGAESCCVDDAPNSPNPGLTSQGPGGGRIGAVLLSPYIKPGTTNAKPYNHYSLLRSVEDIFGLKQLGYAAKSTGFGADVYNGPRCFDHPLPRKRKTSSALPKGTLIKSVKRAGRALTIRLAHSAKVVVKTGSRSIFSRSGKACATLKGTLPAVPTSVVIVATSGKRSERRLLQ
jgi:hypothetical protein